MRFEGTGVYYAATFMEAQLCAGEEIVIIGGGNSAGQAAVFLAQTAKRVNLLVRSGGLADNMSRYLIRRIEESPNIVLRTHTEVVAVEGGDHLETVSWRNSQTGSTETQAIRHVFVFAVGDVRAGNIKRVASAVGEGSIAVAFVHQVLHE